MDILAGIAYADDGQVADLRVLRVADDAERARLVVEVWPLPAMLSA